MKPSTTTGFVLRRSAEHQAGNAADLKSADFGQHVQRVGRVGLVELDGPPNHGDFVRERRVVDAGAAAR